jgi:hypothetical protein
MINQLFLQNPATLPVWVCGLLFLLFAKAGRDLRALGLLAAALFIFQIASQSSRPDRIAGIYPLLFATGGVAIEAFVSRTGRRWLLCVLFGVMALFGVLLAPVGLPILPPETLAEYCSAVGVVPKLERGKTSPLPQWFADRFEWESFVGVVKNLYDGLPPGDRSRAVIYAPSYGHAGALEFYAPALGLPHVICNQNSYYMWSAGNADADVLIAVGARAADLRSVYARVDSIGIIRGKYGMSWRNNMKIYLAREPTTPLNAVWGGLKHYE